MDDRLLKIQKLLDAAEGNLASARNMLRDFIGDKILPSNAESKIQQINDNDEGNIIEGIFTGEEMVDPDGKTYPVSANYASKSKLVEGDGLKLTIAEDGSFIYKQIMPVDRKNVVGTLSLDGSSYRVLAEGKSYKVLTASITFYKAEPGDSVTVIIPKDHDAEWAAMENVLIKSPSIEGSANNDYNQNIIGGDSQIVAEKGIAMSDKDFPLDTADSSKDEISSETTTEPIETSQNAGQRQSLQQDSANASNEANLGIDTPKIEFPGGKQELSDDQLLEKLKSNLQNPSPIPANVSVDTISSSIKSVNNTTDNDSSNTHKPIADLNNDQPISELEI